MTASLSSGWWETGVYLGGNIYYLYLIRGYYILVGPIILRNTESPARDKYDKVQLIHSFWQEPIDQSFFFLGQYPQRGKEGAEDVNSQNPCVRQVYLFLREIKHGDLRCVSAVSLGCGDAGGLARIRIRRSGSRSDGSLEGGGAWRRRWRWRWR